MCFSQTSGTITVAASMDTTTWIPARSAGLLELDFTALSGSLDSLWVGYSNDKNGFVSASGFPIVMARNTYKQWINGVWRYRIGVMTTGNWPGEYVVIRYKLVNSAVGGWINWKLR